ncbi:hypothetical protein IE53DRAFT_189903 [Violaceomyces palustris]|uniref:Uncharacterized protein n=1 Tax=Violaceomyces palustris TaxID=1673888 RepID=A0ACD0P8J5_9BASI|nr:hypothetical protein IE53DRAFT_189903 [Violaceomyces palustris]
MDYFSKLSSLVGSPAKVANGRGGAGKKRQGPKSALGDLAGFHRDWEAVKLFLRNPDERALYYGIDKTDLSCRLRSITDSLVFESNRASDENTGACMEYLLKNDVLGELVDLSEHDRPPGIKAEVIRTFTNLIILLDERFLSRQAVHKAVAKLIRTCVGDDGELEDDRDFEESGHSQSDFRFQKAGTLAEEGFEEDLVDLMCHIASRLRGTPGLLMIFFREEKRRGKGLSADSTDEREAQIPVIDVRPPSPALSSASTATLQPPRHVENEEQQPGQVAPESDRLTLTEASHHDFPLFNYLLRFLHREGRTGELARAGLLFIVAIASSSPAPRRFDSDRLPASDKDGTELSHADPEISLALAHFILNSDFSDVLAAGLGAVYGLLPGKLRISPPKMTPAHDGGSSLGPMSLSIGNGSENPEDQGKDDFFAQDFPQSHGKEVQDHMNLLVDLLEFVQDVVPAGAEGSDLFSGSAGGCQWLVVELTRSISDAVERIFLKNVLYPSLLESSDSDGSAVAVMSYLEVIFSVLSDDHPLSDVVFGYLIGVDGTAATGPPATLGPNPKFSTSASARGSVIRRRRSVAFDLVTNQVDRNYYSEATGRYSLKDLISDNLRETTQPSSAIAALKLTRTLLSCHGRLASRYLLDSWFTDQPLMKSESVAKRPASLHPDHVTLGSDTEGGTDAVVSSRRSDGLQLLGRSAKQHVLELDVLSNSISKIETASGDSSWSTGFSRYLSDAEQAIRYHSSFQQGFFDSLRLAGRSVGNHTTMQAPSHHRLNVGASLMKHLFTNLVTFFSNRPDLNIALTGTLSSIAQDPYRNLQGWLVWEEMPDHGLSEVTQLRALCADEAVDGLLREKASPSENGGSSDETTEDIDKVARSEDTPILLGLLLSLVESVERYRNQVDSFEDLLRERKRGLLYVENLNEALSLESTGSKEEGEGSAANPSPPPSLFVPVGRKQPSKEAMTNSGGIEANDSTDSNRSTSLSSRQPAPPSSTERPSPSVQGFARFFSSKARTQKIQDSRSSNRSQEGTTPSDAISVPPSNLYQPRPFDEHYKRTAGTLVETHPAFPLGAGKDWFWNREGPASGSLQKRRVTLSSVLDNVVILEEFIKELMAIIQVRTELGIDSIDLF